jgi:hypothetical protein
MAFTRTLGRVGVFIGVGIALAIAIVVAIDASSLGVHKGLIPGFWNMGIAGWFFAVWLVVIVGLPAYLIMRPKLRAAAGGRPMIYNVHVEPAGWAPAADLWQPSHHVPTETKKSPPPNWYTDPERAGFQRWWDGAGWTDERRPQITR